MVVFDFETASPVNLKKHGRIRYSKHPDTVILMMSYKYDDGPTHLWLPGDELPLFVKEPNKYTLCAFNAQFEYAIWNDVGVSKYGFTPCQIKSYTDIMALCGRYGLPQSLEKACEVLKTKHGKNPEGKFLINTFCIAPYGRAGDITGDIEPHFLPKWERFKQYCIDDTEAEYEVLNSLPASHLSDSEQKTWEHSCTVNLRGLPVDVKSATRIYELADLHRTAQYELLSDMTEGRITKITQAKRLCAYINDLGIPMENCQKETVAELLQRPDLPEKAMMLLEMRAELGMSSIGKYIRIIDHEYNGRVYDSQRYYGAHTGRWTGSGVQFHNLPRASVPDPEAEIDSFFTGAILNENPVKSARALIRPMVQAPRGNILGFADYSSIEYVVIEWVAGNSEALESFSRGECPYIREAASLYGRSYEDIHEGYVKGESWAVEMRRHGKVIVLSCGYQQGTDKFLITSDRQYGVKLTYQEAQKMVGAYRSNHWRVAQMWYKLRDLVVIAIQNPGNQFNGYRCSFKTVKDHTGISWLTITLPSGRTMYYREPFIEYDHYGASPMHMGMLRTSNSWMPLRLIPGRITENIVQAIARDILVHGMLTAEAAGYKTILSVYDEIVWELPEGSDENTLKHAIECMCSKQEWAKDIPLRADGILSKRYKKM